VPAQHAEAFADYRAGLDRAGVSEHTRRAYASRVAGYLRWLAGTDLADERAVGDPTGADPLADTWARDFAARDFAARDFAARDFAARDYRVWPLTVAKKAPNTVNAHLTAVDAFYTHRGLGPAHAGRVDLPQQAPRALEEAELRGAERRPSVRDKTIMRTLHYAGVRAAELVALDVDDVPTTARTGKVIVRAGKGQDCAPTTDRRSPTRSKIWRAGSATQAPGRFAPLRCRFARLLVPLCSVAMPVCSGFS
jgi:integrase